MFSDYFYLGKITKKFGVKGELLVYIDSDEPEKYYRLESVFFNVDGEPIPFFTKEIKVKSKHQIIVLFRTIDNTTASHYVNTDLYLPISMLPKLTGNKFYYHEIKGFTVIDTNKGNLGNCDEIIDYSHHAVMQILHPKGEILIPIAEEYIKNLDKENKIIEIETPEGLIDLYIEDW
ncbi:MAG: ribosome maturation factor RimM [Bacteroidales bacterium]|jgi:16S rRNA processing protein RimM|nr:ribosome maturation factor RimM [Bacteroidales bacterium]